MNFTKVKIVTTVPINSADNIRQVLGESGGGIIGEYSFCSFSVIGNGYFTPSKDAKPYIGKPNQSEIVKEERIEIICDRSKAKSVIIAMKLAHPYEQPICDIYPLIDELEL